MYCFPV